MFKLTLLRKVALAVTAMAMLVGLQFVVGSYQGGKLERSLTELAEHEVPILLKVKDLQYSIAQVQQWLSDISATRGRDGLNDGLDEAQRYAVQSRALLEQLSALDRGNKPLYARVARELEPYYEKGKEMASRYVAEGPAGGNALMSEFDAAAARLQDALEPVLDLSLRRMRAGMAAQREAFSSEQTSLVAVSLGMVVALGIVIWAVRTALVHLGGEPQALKALAARIRDGDLGQSMDMSGAKPGSVCHSLGELQQKFAVLVERDLTEAIAGAAAGDFGRRIDSGAQSGVFRMLVERVNVLMNTSEQVFSDVERVLSALAQGDLSERIQGELHGLFADLQKSVARTSERLDDIVTHDIMPVVASAIEGDLDARVGVDGKQGFFLALAESINELLAQNSRIVSDVSRVMSGLARGDLGNTVTSAYRGELDRLKSDTNATIAKLVDVTGEIRQVAKTVESNAAGLSRGGGELATRSAAQAASLEETAASMEEMTATVRQNAERAEHASELAQRTERQATRGGDVVDGAVQAMDAIEDSSRQIADITTVVEEIAFQTNLLALNASVEAARAGEQGRGFAVVAGEVRNLAGRSASAAKEITALIQESVSKVEEGSRLVDESGETLRGILASVEKVSEIVAEIARANREQSLGIEQVNSAMLKMDAMTQQTVQLVKGIAEANTAMNAEAERLNRHLAFFSGSGTCSNAVPEAGEPSFSSSPKLSVV